MYILIHWDFTSKLHMATQPVSTSCIQRSSFLRVLVHKLLAIP